MLKNMKMSNKMILMIATPLLIGLVLICTLTNSNLRSTINTDTRGRFAELVDARAIVIDQYFQAYTNWIASIGSQQFLRDALKDPSEENIAYARVLLGEYKNSREGMEGMFFADKDGTLLIHTDHPEQEGGLFTSTSLDTINEKTSESTNHTWLKGISVSSSTGEIVAPVYCAIYDADNTTLLGYVGGGTYITELKDLVYNMELNGYDSSQIYLVNPSLGNIIFAPNEEEIGTDYDSNTQNVVDAAISEGKGIIEFDYGSDTMMMCYQYLEDWNFVLYMLDDESEIFASVNRLSITIMVISIVVLVILVLIVLLVSKNISKDISDIGAIITSLGTLDLTNAERIRKYSDRKDEVGQIALATGKLAGAVRDSVQNLRARASELKDGSQKLIENSNETMTSVGQVDKAIQEIAQGATSQSSETQSATEAVMQIGSMVEDTKEQTIALKEAAESMHSSSKEVEDILATLRDISQKTRASVDVISEQTNQTNASAEKIKEATALISEIASQTNLLSLNASIEAARAGETGKGFAVVASEIGKLAEQSSDSAQKIEDIINVLVENSVKAVDTMEEVKGVIDQQSEYVEKTAEIFGNVENQIQNSFEGIENISAKVETLDVTRKNVVDVVQNLTAIAEENAASTEETSASTSMVNSMIGEVSEIANNVSELAENINNDVNIFKV